MSENWKIALCKNAKSFQIISLVNQEFQKASESTQKLIKRSRLIAERSYFLILACTDEIYFWTLTNFDKQVNVIYGTCDWRSAYLWATKLKIIENVQGQIKTQYNSINQQAKETKLYKRIALGLTELSEIYQKNYEKCQETLSMKAQKSKEKMNEIIVSIKNITIQDILEKEWPQNFLDQFDLLITYFGGQELSQKLQNSILDRLDHDEDGVLTIGDIYESTEVSKIVEWSSEQAKKFTSLFVVNGKFD